MILLEPERFAALRDWFVPDRPGPLVGLHVLQTGSGASFVDRWPQPRALLVETTDNCSLAGDPAALHAEDLPDRLRGFVDAPETFVPLLHAAFPQMRAWDRVIFEQPVSPPSEVRVVRRLTPADVHHLWALSPYDRWICKTWGGPAGLASSGHAWGAFVDGRLRSVACTFFVGDRYEDIGVVTEAPFRGQGLSVACARALCEEVHRRGRRPSWTTSPDNTASLRVAEKLGFVLQRHDRLYVVGVPIPES
jgi:RimJ/RimL family protein N-acetyltransferase